MDNWQVNDFLDHKGKGVWEAFQKEPVGSLFWRVKGKVFALLGLELLVQTSKD